MMIRLYDVGQEVNKAEIIMYSESFHREYEMKRKKRLHGRTHKDDQ